MHGVVGYACSPTMQTPSPTQKPLAGMHASAAAAERVFSAQPIVQETESARGTDEKDEVYGGLLLKATPPKKSVRSPGLLDNATVGGAEQWIKGGDSESEEESPVLSANTKAYVEDSFVEGQPRSAVQGYRFGLGQLLRGRVRPMAGDSPSGERLAGQSGLVFHIGGIPGWRGVLTTVPRLKKPCHDLVGS